MALNEQDRAWVRQEIQTAYKRRGLGKLTGAIRDWSGTSAAVAVLILAFTQWGGYVEFKTHTSDRLDTLERDVHSLQRAQVSASLNSAVQEAKVGQKDNAIGHVQQTTDLLQELIEDRAPAPASFFESAVNTLNQLRSTGVSEASIQQASVRLAEYRSALNPPPTLPKTTEKLPSNAQVFAYSFKKAVYPMSTSFVASPPKPVTVSGYGTALDASGMKPGQEIVVPATRSLEENPLTIEGLTIIGATQTLDYITWRDVTFVNTHIKYSGGPARLLNVRFINCTFDLPSSGSGAQLAEYAAIEPKQEITVG